MILSYGLLAFFLFFGATLFMFEMLGTGLVSYVINLPALTFTIWDQAQRLGHGRQAGLCSMGMVDAFAPFVGIFLAVFQNRTIREFVFGAIVLPSLM